ncbi:ABC transporter substrate-binding protein [Allostreptomyces psammosilenae]|uniref:Xylobiose transport system substrate-binding protein n=1 Tax=Allostreptomyces psammosilenae TaxID=1892865 RepID=A0A853A0B5_9ACTN|nr:extracellular solute-binding protein [Allostreptomyces psammosilenae]NYI06374.1 xylobiose transport system substrate-binding protein [Allostreptomyces psammosilenae]
MTTTHQLGRRGFLAAMAAGAAALTLSGCGAASGTGRRNGLGVWTLQDAVQNEIQQGAIDAFVASSGESASLNVFPNTGFTQKLRVAMGSGDGPDVFFNWGGASLRPYFEAGMAVDLTDELERDQAWRDAFLPSVLDAGRIDGRYCGIPLRGMQPVILFYNRQVFDAAGVEPPATYDDMLDLIEVFKSRDTIPIALAGTQSWCELMWIEYLADRLGGAQPAQRAFNAERGAWEDPAMVGALERIRELVDLGAFGSNFTAVTYEAGGASTLFAQGRAAMHLMGSWEYTNQLDQQPEFARDGLAWAPFPTIAGGTGDPRSVVGNPTNYFSVNASSGDAAAGVEFLRTQMASDAYVDALIAGGDVPAVAGLEQRLDNHPSPEFAKYVYSLVQEAPDFTLSWDQALPPAVKEIMLSSLQRVFLGELSPEQFVETMEVAQ